MLFNSLNEQPRVSTVSVCDMFLRPTLFDLPFMIGFPLEKGISKDAMIIMLWMWDVIKDNLVI